MKMTMKNLFAAAALVGALSACGGSGPSESQSDDSNARGKQGQVHSGSGVVQSVSGSQIRIAHGPIESLGWPAMTMAFNAPPGLEVNVRKGALVDFSFRRDGSTYVLTAVHTTELEGDGAGRDAP
jgi:Cu(I)/Ag(I) efflux system periplasmic protein CusF